MFASMAETPLIYVSFSVAVLYGPAVLLALAAGVFFLRRRSRLERRQEKHRRIRENIALRARDKRRRMALKTQRQNIRELAGLVAAQLDDRKRDVTPYQHQRTSAFIERAVTCVDFDRLFALHALFAQTTQAKDVSPAVEAFFAKENAPCPSLRTSGSSSPNSATP